MSTCGSHSFTILVSFLKFNNPTPQSPQTKILRQMTRSGRLATNFPCLHLNRISYKSLWTIKETSCLTCRNSSQEIRWFSSWSSAAVPSWSLTRSLQLCLTEYEEMSKQGYNEDSQTQTVYSLDNELRDKTSVTRLWPGQ